MTLRKPLTALAVSLLIFGLGLSAAHAGAGNPSREIEGDSLQEKQLKWAWQHRKDFLKSCLVDKECSAQGPTKDLLTRIYRQMSSTSDQQIQFKSEKSNPGLFVSNQGDIHRIAMTSNRPGSPIYFNTDLIYGLNLENMVGVVFHELTHHLGIADDAQRLPDQVGAAMAKHFRKNTLRSPYTGIENSKVESAVFQSSFGDEVKEEFFFTNFGFITDGHFFADSDFGAFNLSPGCNKDGYKIAAQRTETPVWRESIDSNGKKNIRVTMLFNNLCYKRKFVFGADHDVSKRNYTFRFYLTPEGRIDPTQDMTERLADSMGAYMDYISTIQLIEMRFSNTQIKSGGVLNIVARIKSFTPLKPQKCQLGLAIQGTPVDNEDGMPRVNTTPECRITEVSDGIWELQTSLPISSNFASGNYFARLIFITGTGGDGAAYLQLPEKYGFTVTSSNTAAGFSIVEMTAPNLTPLKNFGAQALTNSYRYSQGQKIDVYFKIKSAGPVRIKGLAFYTLSNVNNELTAIKNTMSIEDLPEMQMTQKSVNSEPGYQTIQLSFVIPTMWLKHQTFGLSLQEVIFENDSFQITSWNAKGTFDSMFLVEEIIQANP